MKYLKIDQIILPKRLLNQNSAEKFIAINSDNDPYVPLNKGEILRDKLGAELIVVPKGSHLNEGAGFTKLPIVLESLLKIL